MDNLLPQGLTNEDIPAVVVVVLLVILLAVVEYFVNWRNKNNRNGPSVNAI